MNAGPPKRLIVRIAVAVAFVLTIVLYLAHIQARDQQRAEAARTVYAELNRGQTSSALTKAADALQSLGETPELKRAAWTSLMAGRRGSRALLRRSFPHRPKFKWIPGEPDPSWLSFSNDGRFLAAIDGPSITVWNVEDGSQVVTTTAGDRFVGFFRIGSRYFGLLASHQFYDLVSDVVSLPEGYRYAQPSKDALTAVAPGGDWAYRLPAPEEGRTEYPVKLVNLHTGEKREVDINYRDHAPVGVNSDASRIAIVVSGICDPCHAALQIWNARSRLRIASKVAVPIDFSLYYSKAQDAFIVASLSMLPAASGHLEIIDPETGNRLASLTRERPTFDVADDPGGKWFAMQTDESIELYRGPNSPYLSLIAKREVSRAPATSR
jgi:hypothetical protein